ncbi:MULTISPECIES: hypothetical protein [Mesorhizobium]|uniref:hypothetical protein n=1 Tax=Mesorhizobium TaxID=68287 RepID=UPI0010A95E13|nr:MULTISPECIES: hypothetical protein [Mesorhizobium]
MNIIAKTEARCAANPADPPHRSGPAMRFALPSIFRHRLSRGNGPLKSTKFYYPAKIFELVLTNAMIVIRNPASHLARPAKQGARPVRMQAAT